MVSDGEKEVVTKTVSGFPIGFLTVKGLELGPTHSFIFPILCFLSYEFPHFHCPHFHSLSLFFLFYSLNSFYKGKQDDDHTQNDVVLRETQVLFFVIPIQEWQLVGFRQGFTIPGPNPRVETRDLNPVHLLNGFFIQRPHGPCPSRPDLGLTLGPNHGPITIYFFKAQMPKIGLISLKYEERERERERDREREREKKEEKSYTMA